MAAGRFAKLTCREQGAQSRGVRAWPGDPWADCAAAFQLGRLHQCRACRHFAATIPPGGDRLGLQDAGWCQRYSVATRPLDPFYCRDYTARVH